MSKTIIMFTPAQWPLIPTTLNRLSPSQCLLWLEHCCQHCALPLASSAVHCCRCLLEPAAFGHLLSLWRHEFPINALIQRFKHQANRSARRFLETQLSWVIGINLAQGYKDYDAVLALPSHPLKRLWQGYNPSHLLANTIPQHCQRRCIQVLKKNRWSHSQQSLNRAQRQKPQRQLFSALHRERTEASIDR